jgi:hypothetical protein
MLIKNFFNTIQADVTLIADKISGNLPNNDEQNKKVVLAALRIFVSIMMGVAIVSVFTAVPLITVAPASALFKIAINVLAIALYHDAFVMFKNHTDQMNPINYGIDAVKSIGMDLYDLWAGEKKLNDAPRYPHTKGTLFEPLWNFVAQKAQQYKDQSAAA